MTYADIKNLITTATTVTELEEREEQIWEEMGNLDDRTQHEIGSRADEDEDEQQEAWEEEFLRLEDEIVALYNRYEGNLPIGE